MIGAKIKCYLNENGIKQSYVCKKANITPSQMSDICNKDRSIDCLLYFRICKALDLPLEYFLKEEA